MLQDDGNSDRMTFGCERIRADSGSACTSESLEPSYVLRSLGVGEETAHTSLRIGIGMIVLCSYTVCV